MSAELQEHAPHAAEAVHAFDSPEEIAHAKKHALENIGIFLGFFGLIVVAVANYELWGVDSAWAIFFLAATRVAWITFFFAWLFRSYSYVVKTFVFAIFFLMGMIWLSIFDSDLPFFCANPIKKSGTANQTLFQPKPLPPTKS